MEDKIKLYEDKFKKQIEYLSMYNISNETEFRYVIENNQKIFEYDKNIKSINNNIIEENKETVEILEDNKITEKNEINNIDKNENVKDNYKIDNIDKLKKELCLQQIKDETYNTINDLNKQLDNNTLNVKNNLEKNIINKNEDPKIKVEKNNDVKYSSIVLNRIKDFYINFIKYNLYDGNNNEIYDIKKLKYEIDLDYKAINSKKANIIYIYYKLFKLYLDEKQKDEKLKFLEFINHKPIEKRYNEKVNICYKFIRDVLEKVKDININEEIKQNIIINILSNCRLSINKLYRIRGKEYIQLIDFISPFYIERCKEIIKANIK